MLPWALGALPSFTPAEGWTCGSSRPKLSWFSRVRAWTTWAAPGICAFTLGYSFENPRPSPEFQKSLLPLHLMFESLLQQPLLCLHTCSDGELIPSGERLFHPWSFSCWEVLPLRVKTYFLVAYATGPGPSLDA